MLQCTCPDECLACDYAIRHAALADAAWQVDHNLQGDAMKLPPSIEELLPPPGCTGDLTRERGVAIAHEACRLQREADTGGRQIDWLVVPQPEKLRAPWAVWPHEDKAASPKAPPFPWRVGDNPWQVVDANGFLVADCFGHDETRYVDACATANAIVVSANAHFASHYFYKAQP